MNSKKININNKYEIRITWNNDVRRLYVMYDLVNDKRLCESFSLDSFLIKANKIVKLGNKIECLIASY